MPVACWPAEAAICAAACAASFEGRRPACGSSRRPRLTVLIAALTPLVTSSVDSTAVLVAFWISPRIWRTCAVAFFDWSASALTSPATTPKPAPCSPARDASMRGVERQQVGLLGDVVDRGDDLADGLRLLGQRQDVLGDGLDLLLDRAHRGRPSPRPPCGRPGRPRAARCADSADGLGALRRLLGGLQHLVDRGDGLGHRRGLLLQPAACCVVPASNLRGGRRQGVGRSSKPPPAIPPASAPSGGTEWPISTITTIAASVPKMIVFACSRCSPPSLPGAPARSSFSSSCIWRPTADVVQVFLPLSVRTTC